MTSSNWTLTTGMMGMIYAPSFLFVREKYIMSFIRAQRVPGWVQLTDCGAKCVFARDNVQIHFDNNKYKKAFLWEMYLGVFHIVPQIVSQHWIRQAWCSQTTSNFLHECWWRSRTHYCINTLRPRQNGHHLQMTFSNSLHELKLLHLIKISLKFVPKGSFNNKANMRDLRNLIAVTGLVI